LTNLEIPPILPTLIVLTVFCWITSSTLVIDWHNIPHTVLKENNRSHDLIVALSKW
jgi:hypothetical protein